jgi:methionyl-tRNA formyltransferase
VSRPPANGRPEESVLLLGLGPTALSALESLSERFSVVGLVRSPSPSGEDEVVERARTLGVPVLNDTGVDVVERAVLDSRPDCVVVSSYDRILPARVLEASARFVNVHYAPLPAYRGRANVNWAILNGEPETAITVHVLAPGLDAGNILYQQKVLIGPDDTVGELYAKLNDVQRRVLADTVARHLSGYRGEPQDESAATYGCTRVPEDGEIHWEASTARIYALVRALAAPYPGAHTYLEGCPIRVLRARPLENPPRYVGRVPGRVVGRSARTGHVDVLTGDGVLRIERVRDGASEKPASDVVRSTRQTLGLRTADLLARIGSLELLLRSAGVTDRDRAG